MNGYFGTHYFGRLIGKGAAPVGRRIAVEMTCAGNSDWRIASKHRKRLQIRQANVEEFARLVADAGDNAVSVPPALAKAILAFAANGVRPHQGRSGTFKSQADEDAYETVKQEAPQIYRWYLDEAKKKRSKRTPRHWAKEETVKAVQKRLRELGVANPLAVTTIMKKWKF